jgi:peptidoglycan/LPS O-acetylase OafA/YrhL
MSSGIGDTSVLQSDARPALQREAGAGHLHIPALDGLRGIAVLSVMLYHFAMSPAAGSRLNDLLVRVSRFGWIGVDLFFVLSGFLITGILINAKDSRHYFRNFYARRTVRIFPLYYGVLALFYLVAPQLNLYSPQGIANAQHYQAWFWLYASNFLTAFKGGWVFEQFTHFWSLAVEEHFYLVWPAIVYLVPTRRLGWVCGAFIIGGLIVRVVFELRGCNMYYAHLLTPSRVDSLAMGGLIAVLGRREGGLFSLARPARIVAVTSLLAIVAIYLKVHDFQPGKLLVRTAGFSLLALFFGAILVLSMTTNSIGGRILRGRFLRFFGKYSYGLYVFHVLIVPWVRQWAGAREMAEKVGAFPALMVHIAACFAISILCALISWHCYEKWFLKLKRFF